MASATTYLKNKLADEIDGKTEFTKPTMWAGIFSTAPTMPAGTGGTELSGGGYARVQVSGNMAASSGGVATSNADISFPEATSNWGTPAAIGYWDASTGGNLLLVDSALSSPPNIVSGDTFTIPSGDLTVTES